MAMIFILHSLISFVRRMTLEDIRQLHMPLQENGVAEQMSRTSMKRAMSMFSGVNLEKKFCAKMVPIACYLINKYLTSTLIGKSPMEVVTRKISMARGKPQQMERHLEINSKLKYAR
jgi:hypothetical protein